VLLFTLLAGAAGLRADSVTTLGTMPISADTIVANGFGTLLTLPVIAEEVAGEWQAGSTILLVAPAGFEFDPNQITAVIFGDIVLLDNTPPHGTAFVTFNVVTASTGASQIGFSGVRLRHVTDPNCTAGERADITVTCSGGNNLNVSTQLIDVTVVAGFATRLGFVQQPTNTVAGGVISPAVTVEVLDQCDNLATTSTALVAMAIGTNPGGGTLSGTTARNAVAGLATFNDLSINKTGTGYTLAASSAVLTGATSVTFNITPAAATHLGFVQQPTNTVAGVAISPAVTVQILDAFENRVTTSTASIAMAIGTNPGGGTLSGTTPRNAVAGLATFNDLSINKTGTGYTLAASSTGLTSATSMAFNITPAAAHHLGFVQQPTNAVAGVVISPAVTVEVLDAFNNRVTWWSSSVTMAIGTNPGGGTLSGTTTRNAVAGLATFNDLSIDTPGVGYTLAATSAGLTGANSASFNITPAAATHLGFVQQPTNTVAGYPISPAVTVEILDAFNNRVTWSSSSVTMAIGTNPGGGTLNGTTTRNAVAGLATFNDLSIDTPGVGYTLAASSAGLTGANSASFNITTIIDHLAFIIQPVNTAAGSALPPVVVAGFDALNNLVTTWTGPVTLTLGMNPPGGILHGTTTRNAVAGLATFTDLWIDRAGCGYTLHAAAPGALPADSLAFCITPGPAFGLVFTVQPVSTPLGAPLLVQVAIVDSFGNVVVNDDRAISLALQDNPCGATLYGTTALLSVNGLATWTAIHGLNITVPCTGYALQASHSGPPFGGSDTVVSAAFNILLTLGDLNCDGHVNFNDINPFVLAITSAAQYALAYPNCNRNFADCNHDGVVDFDDINPFVAILSGGG
jgi:hypothetical protein